MTIPAVTAASIPVLLVVILIGVALIVGSRPFASAVADQWSGAAARRRLEAAVRMAMLGMGGVWVALGLVGLVVHLVDR